MAVFDAYVRKIAEYVDYAEALHVFEIQILVMGLEECIEILEDE